MRYVEAVREAGLPCAVVSSSANTQRGAPGRRASSDLFERAGRRADRGGAESLKGKPAPDTFLAAARAARRRAGRGGGVRGRAGRRRGRARRRLRLRRRRRPRRGRRRRCASTAPTSSSRTWPSCSTGRDHPPGLPVEPWSVRETRLDLDVLAQTESVFALSNGHIGLRGNLDEGEPRRAAGHVPELVLRAAAAALRRGRLRLPGVRPDGRQRHQRQDHPAARRRRAVRRPLRHAALARAGARPARRRPPAPHRVGLAGRHAGRASPRRGSSRSRSGPRRRSCTRSSRSTPRSGSSCSPSWSRTSRAATAEKDPRAAAALEAPLVSEFFGHDERRVVLVHSTRAQQAPDGGRGWTTCSTRPDVIGRARVQLGATSARVDRRRRARSRAQRLRIVKFLAYGWSSQRSLPALRDQVVAALAAARHTGWDGLLAAQRAYLDEFWDRRRRRARRRPRAPAGRALRALPHAPGRGARRAAGDRGQGPDRPRLRRPHLLGHRALRPARADLHRAGRRRRRAPLAPLDARPRARARPPARPRRRRVPVADDPRPGVLRLLARGHRRVPRQRRHRRRRRSATRRASDDEAFEREVGLELLVETARLWRSLGHHDADGSFRIDGVTGPGRVQRARRQQRLHEPAGAAEPRGRRRRGRAPPAAAAALGVDREEAAAWRDAAGTMVDPVGRAPRRPPAVGGLHRATRSGTSTARAPEQYPLLLHFPYFDLYRKQVVKQADLVLALHSRGDAFTDEEKARDFDYYEPLTVRDSSLSACTQAVVAAEVGHLDLAYDYFAEAALMDLHDLAAQHPRRPPHRLARGRLDRRGRRLRRHARPRRAAQLRPAAAAPAAAARVPARLPRPQARGRGDEARRRPTRCSRARRSRSPTTARTSRSRGSRSAAHPAAAGAHAAGPAAWPRAAPLAELERRGRGRPRPLASTSVSGLAARGL